MVHESGELSTNAGSLWRIVRALLFFVGTTCFGLACLAIGARSVTPGGLAQVAAPKSSQVAVLVVEPPAPAVQAVTDQEKPRLPAVVAVQPSPAPVEQRAVASPPALPVAVAREAAPQPPAVAPQAPRAPLIADVDDAGPIRPFPPITIHETKTYVNYYYYDNVQPYSSFFYDPYFYSDIGLWPGRFHRDRDGNHVWHTPDHFGQDGIRPPSPRLPFLERQEVRRAPEPMRSAVVTEPRPTDGSGISRSFVPRVGVQTGDLPGRLWTPLPSFQPPADKH